jgi:hypothetical protein
VVFSFDEAANATAASGFHLIRTNGAVLNGQSIQGGQGTQNIVVRFAENVTAAQVARGTVDANNVAEASDNDSDGIDSNVLQAADVSQSGNSDFPDLVSVELREVNTTGGDQALFTFDEPISTASGSVNPGSLRLYYVEATGSTPAQGTGFQINPGDTRQVLVNYAEDAINNAVGGQALADAVLGTDGNRNEDDEVGVANSTTTPGRTAGKIAGPDLIGVKLTTRTSPFGGVVGVNATYTFDEAVTGNPDESKFFLYLANGERLTPDSAITNACTVNDNGTTTNTKDDTNVVCQFTGPVGDLDLPGDAVLGTVDDDAVVAEDGLAPTTNPEGAEPATK